MSGEDQTEKLLLQPSVAMEIRGHQNCHVVCNAHCSTIERLMVHRAACQAVVDAIGASRLNPANVSGFKSQIRVVESHTKATESALMSPCR